MVKNPRYRVAKRLGETGLELLPAQSVPFDGLSRLLDEIDRFDCLNLPWRETFDSKRAFVMMHQGLPIACAWIWGERGLDVRVHPQYRKQGIATLLLSHLSQLAPLPVWVQHWNVHFDLANRAALEMAERINVRFEKVLRHLCWEGSEEDVPHAFQVARLQSVQQTDRVQDFLKKNKISFVLSGLEASRLEAQIAVLEGSEVGCLVAERLPEAFELRCLFIQPEHRCFGIGRSLVCHLMERAAQQHCGICLRLSEDYEKLVDEEEGDEGNEDEDLPFEMNDWFSHLGFWTYRTTILGVYRLPLRQKFTPDSNSFQKRAING